MKCAPTWQDVNRYCTQLGQSMNLCNNEQFEITGVTLCQDNDACTSVSEDCVPRDVFDCSTLSSTCMCDIEEDNPNRKTKEKMHVDVSDYCNDLSDSREHVLDNGSDIEIVSEVVDKSSSFKFRPLTFEHQKALCKALAIGKVKSISISLQGNDRVIGKPDQIRRITGDGNCFFRGVSYAISGTERNHMRVRMATVNQLLKHASYYKT